MDKNSVIGFILITVILFGFTFIQSKKAKEQYAIQAQKDSIAMVAALERAALDSAYAANAAALGETAAPFAAARAAAPERNIHKDTLLDVAMKSAESRITLENDLFEVVLTTKGAQPYSVRLKDFRNYDSTDLYIFRPGENEYAVNVYAGEYINTKDFNFTVWEKTDTSVTMRLAFSDGGYIQQRYSIREGEYIVSNDLSFVGMNSIPRNVGAIDLDYSSIIPRMEKGFKNESQYSKLDYYFNGDKKPSEMGRGRNASKRIDSKLSWFAFQQQFFSTIMRAKGEFASGELGINFYAPEDRSHNLMACSAKMRLDYRPGEDATYPFEFYFGPNHFKSLKSYGQKYEKIVPLGGNLVGWFTKFVIIPLFDFLHRFIDNYGLIILLMTIIIKIVVLPFTYKSYASSAKMQALKPEIEKINAKYPKQEDAMKKQQATMDLYKRADASPMGGCLPTLLTFPILWAMFRFFPASIELRQQHFLWAEDLSAYDSIVDFGSRVPLIGDHLSLFALLMAVTMWAYSKMTTANQAAANDPSAASMKFMSLWLMPIMMFFICNSLSAALSYYYLLSQLISMLEIWIIKKWCVDPEAILEKVRKSEGKPLPKSKWQQRLEAAQKMQEQQQRNRR